ncbi:MAG TPA: hypothetical protein VE669_03445 [Actinomycetota bacterium]|nr:hypothetical protein [Actinomycetota bacterium]
MGGLPSAGSAGAEGFPLERLRRYRLARRLGIVSVAIVVAMGLGGVLGVRERTVTATAGGYELQVTYAAVTRPGLSTVWEVIVRHEGGFDGRIGIATTAAYFDGYDFNQLYPEPGEMSERDGKILMTFEPPVGEVLRVRLDARTTPTFHLGHRARTELVIDGTPVVGVDYRTMVMP